jgi:hypothetical protein
METLAVALRVRAAHYEGRGLGGPLAKMMTGVSQALAARRAFDQFRADQQADWAPHPLPAQAVRAIDKKRRESQAAIMSHAQAAMAAVLDWSAQAQRAALRHRPAFTSAQQAEARAQLAALNPGSWPADQVTMQRLRIVRGALAAGNKALASEVLFGETAQTLAEIVKQGDPFAPRPDKHAGRVDDAVWKAEAPRLEDELCGAGTNPEAAKALETWRNVEQEARQFYGIIATEAARMVQGEEW